MNSLVKVLIISVVMTSCAGRRQLETARDMSVDIALPASYANMNDSHRSFKDTLATFTDKEGVEHTIGHNTLDEKTGEQLLTIDLQEVKVTARFRNVAERNGHVKIAFNIHVPQELINDNWEVILTPKSNIKDLPGIAIAGANFLAKQKKQYDYFEELCKVIIPENELDQFINRKELEQALARHNRDILRRSKLAYRKTLKTEEYSLRTTEDTLSFVNKFMNSRKVNRNEYFKRILAEKRGQFITLERWVGLQSELVASPDSSVEYAYTAELPATDATGRISVFMNAQIRTLNSDVYPVNISDSLTFVVSSLRNFIQRKSDSSADYQEGIYLLQAGQYREALEILRPYADINTAIGYLALGYDQMAYNTLVTLPDTANSLYLLSIASMRLKKETDAVSYYKKSCALDQAKVWRGNLDPEVSGLITKYKLNQSDY